MIPLFTFRGYTAPDPLDRGSSAARSVLMLVVTLVVATAFNYSQSGPIPIITFSSPLVFWIGTVIMAVFASTVTNLFRKSSSLFFYVIFMLSGTMIDLVLQTRMRDVGLPAFWSYQPGNFISDISTLPLRFVVAWSFDGMILGPLTLWVCRLVASVVFKAPAVPQPTTAQQKALFPDAWTLETVAKPQRDFGFILLRLLGMGYIVYLGVLLIGALGTAPWPDALRGLMGMTYQNPALAIDTFSKITMMTLLAFVGAYNRNVRWYTTLVLMIAHAVSTAGSLAFYFHDTPDTPFHDFLMTSAIVDGVMIVLFIIIMLRSDPSAKIFGEAKDFPSFFSVPAQLMRMVFLTLGFVFLLFIPLALMSRLSGDPATGMGAVFGAPDPTLCNMFTMCSAMSLMCFLMVRSDRLRDYLMPVLLSGLAVVTVATVVWLLIGDVSILTRVGVWSTVYNYFAFHAVADGGILALLIGLRRLYYNVEYTVTALSPSTARGVIAITHAFYGGSSDDQVAAMLEIDRYIAGMRGRKRGILNVPIWVIEYVFSAIYGLRPVLSTMSPDECLWFMRTKMLRRPMERQKAFVPAIANAAQKIGLATGALMTMGSFANLNRRTAIGFVPPDARKRLQGDYADGPPPEATPAAMPTGPDDPANNKPVIAGPKPLVSPRLVTPLSLPAIPDEVDYLVIGSGAGGAVMAYRLACGAADPSKIMLVERGFRYSPLQDFNDHEMEMMQKLYKEGGLQQTKRFDLLVLQGECVGGTTVINNAVCFPMPDRVFKSWQEDYALDLSNLQNEYDRVAAELDIRYLEDTGMNTRVRDRYMLGINAVDATLPPDQKFLRDIPLKVDARNDLGDGAWNLGNRRMRKRSMLETYIPWAEGRGVRVVSNSTAVRFLDEGPTVKHVLLRNAMGDLRSVRVNKAVVLAGGVIASSHFLLRSGLENANIGRHVACNFAFPAVFEFPDIVDAFDGTQITLGAVDPANRAAFETYFNPPGAFALSVPFNFNRHANVMSAYRRLINFGALVGSEARGSIDRTPDILNGRALDWEIGEQDRAHIKYALSTLVAIGKGSGASRAVLPMEPGIDLPLDDASIRQFNAALDAYPLRTDDLLLSTAHPQGGNRMTGENCSAADTRVVDAQFRVDGYSNLYVADASIFPTGITINPQWTIMAMSSLSANEVLSAE